MKLVILFLVFSLKIAANNQCFPESCCKPFGRLAANSIEVNFTGSEKITIKSKKGHYAEEQQVEYVMKTIKTFKINHLNNFDVLIKFEINEGGYIVDYIDAHSNKYGIRDRE